LEYHYGLTIREAREKLGMTQAQLAEHWPQAGGGKGVSVNYVSEVERGNKKISDPNTLRRLCDLLQIPLWKMGLANYDPFDPSTEFDGSGYGILKLTDSPDDRIADYKNCLLEATGDCLISGTSMIHLSEDSGYLLKEKLVTGSVSLLILDPSWISTNASILTFIADKEDREEFHFEIRNSIRKLKEVRKSVSPELASRLRIKTYSTIFPYIITGFDAGEEGKLVVEITDYVPDKFRPRFTLTKQDNGTFYEQVKRKFFSLWNDDSITKEI
jgi:transcriptional regulator with XRE-family HTH domain